MKIKSAEKLVLIFALVIYCCAAVIALQNIFSGNIAFWYDPARDLLLALGNLEKPTLIGPPAGIPGIFYGPYWIWLLSVSLLFSKDPRLASFIVLFLPYFIGIPLLLWKMKLQWGALPVVLIGSLFFIQFSGYSVQLWNPHLAPLLFFLLVYLLASSNFLDSNRRNYIKNFSAGFVFGLLVNFHISFGVGVMGALGIFFFIDGIRVGIHNKKQIRKKIIAYSTAVIIFYLGTFIAYVPFFLFELRHGFNQTQSAIQTILNPFATVGVWGLSDDLILRHFFDVLLRIVGMNWYLLIGVAIVITVNTVYLLYKKEKIKFSDFDIKIALFCLLGILAILSLYLTSKNPVWEYHFIGVEILFLLLIGLLASKLFLLRAFLVIVVLFLFSAKLPILFENLKEKTVHPGTLAAKQTVIDAVQTDAGDKPFEVLVFNPAIYTYDYDYLFATLMNKKVLTDIHETKQGIFIYLIIPTTDQAKMQDFINAKTREIQYKKLNDWYFPDGTIMLKISKLT